MSAQTTSHSPGPWATDVWSYPGATPPRLEVVIVGQSHKLATIDGGDSPYGVDHATQRSNARLIAAAPDLLEALEFLLADYIAIGGVGLTHSNVPQDKAIAAITKAKGTPQ